MKPSESLEKLKDGNDNFVNHKVKDKQNHDLENERLSSLESQTPFAVIVSCSDSRVVPAHIFQSGIGELFEIRSAGNIVDEIGLASIEYAILNLNVPLVLVLGHQNCGAVKAALAADKTKLKKTSTSIYNLAKKIETNIEQLNRDNDEPDHYQNCIKFNAIQVSAHILNKSMAMQSLEIQGKLQVVPSYYSLETGEVEFLVD